MLPRYRYTNIRRYSPKKIFKHLKSFKKHLMYGMFSPCSTIGFGPHFVVLLSCQPLKVSPQLHLTRSSHPENQCRLPYLTMSTPVTFSQLWNKDEVYSYRDSFNKLSYDDEGFVDDLAIRETSAGLRTQLTFILTFYIHFKMYNKHYGNFRTHLKLKQVKLLSQLEFLTIIVL